MPRGSRFPALATLLTLLVAGCSSGADPEEQAAQVPAMCDSIRGLHSDIIDAANDMSSREVDADPAGRSEILATGIDTFADLAEEAELPTEPEALVVGLAERRTAAVSHLRGEAEDFRAEWSTVSQDERGGAVNRVFLMAERLMAEIEPTVPADTPAVVVDAARDHSACEFVLQIPSTDQQADP